MYHIDIAEALPVMSWRRFCVLLAGLGPESLYWKVLEQRREKRTAVVTDPAVAKAIVNKAFFG